MSSYDYEYDIKCRDDCEMRGCQGHKVKITGNNTSDVIVYYKDGEVDFGMDFTELAEFIKHINEMRGWVEIDEIFNDIQKEREESL